MRGPGEKAADIERDGVFFFSCTRLAEVKRGPGNMIPDLMIICEPSGAAGGLFSKLGIHHRRRRQLAPLCMEGGWGGKILTFFDCCFVLFCFFAFCCPQKLVHTKINK